MRRTHIAGILLVLVISTGFTAHSIMPGPHTVTLRFTHGVGDRVLTLSGETYVDPYGEPFTVEKFRYYVSHLRITGDDNTGQVISEDPHLVDEADSSTKAITFSTFIIRIKSIQFLLGVDSIENVSGAQAGDLDPLKGMFWTWNSGYVFAKLEGKSDSSHANAHFLSWHVGGFRQYQNALRTVRLVLKDTPSPGDTITVHADILKWFNALHPIRIAESPVCHDPGPLSMQIADNYASMFSIER